MKLTLLIEQYVTFRQSLGTTFKTDLYILRRFSNEVGEQLAVQDIRPEQVNAFLAGGAGPLTSSWHRKHTALVGFYRYASSRGFVESAPLPTIVPKEPARFVPYIYSREELRRLLEATATYRKQPVLLEPHTLRAILLLLYGAALRLNEALSLTLANVDRPAAVLTIRQTKFYKTRLVPMGSQLSEAMDQYAIRRLQAGHSQGDSAPFFVLRTGARVSGHLVDQAFRRLRPYAGVSRQDGGRYQPRMHDLRHSFAVHRLTSWYQEGANVQRLLPQLSTYLGHLNIAATQVYLTMTPELLREASVRFAQYALKEVAHD